MWRVPTMMVSYLSQNITSNNYYIFLVLGSTTPQHQGQTPRAGPSAAGMDWAKAAQMWAKRSGSTKPGTPRHGQSPRGVRPSPRPSPRQEGYGGGDSTPLFDERWSVGGWCIVQNRYLYIVLYLCEIMKWVKENSPPCFLQDLPYWRRNGYLSPRGRLVSSYGD